MIKLYLAEDQQLLNTALTMILNLETDFEVIGSATDGDTALSDIIKLKPNIVLLDIEMPKLTGLEIAKQLRLLKQDVKIMVLTTFAQEHYFQQALSFVLIFIGVTIQLISQMFVSYYFSIHPLLKYGIFDF